MLGAGASLSSGVKLAQTIIEEIVRKYGPSSSGANVVDTFDELWRASSASNRDLMLAPYLQASPSPGYMRLAELIQLGFFDTIITFNFDRLLEESLNAIGFTDFKTIIRGETDPNAVELLLKKDEPRVKILKIHGSLNSADYFLFSKDEMLNYPEPFRTVFDDLTKRDIIICGYAFNDQCVSRAFNAERESGSIYYVNPSGATENIKGFLIVRRSQDKVISGDFGKFDLFCETLHQHLTDKTPTVPSKPRQNIFKFLDHYSEENRNWFFGRKAQVKSLVKKFQTSPPGTLIISGEPKIGKTSFIRAGMIPYLGSEQYECIYVRCGTNVEEQVRDELKQRFASLDGLDWKQTLERLPQLTQKRIVIFLDQFERPSRAFDKAPEKHSAILDFLNAISAPSTARVSCVLVSASETSFWKLLVKLNMPQKEMFEIMPLTALRVRSIIRHAARKGGIPLDAATIEALCARYQADIDSHRADNREFTLMHLQTFCYYRAKGYQGALSDYELRNQGLQAALNSMTDESSLIDLLDNLPAAERKVIRSFLKVICDPDTDKRKIVEFIKNHFPDLKEDRFPEPIA